MGSYIVRRLLLVPLVLWGTATLLFFLTYAGPGDPARKIAGPEFQQKALPAQMRKEINQKYGLNDPLYEQYFKYLGKLATGDLGSSQQEGVSVASIAGRTVPESARLAFWALVIESTVGIAAGVLSAVRKYSFLDGVITILTIAVGAVPVFVIGNLLIQGFSIFPAQHGWFHLPAEGIGSDSWFLWIFPLGETFRAMILPAFTLAMVETAIVARITRASMIEAQKSDFIRTARAKGILERQVTFRHGLRNALIPVVTLIGLDAGTLLGAAVLTETVFNWPGMGTEIATAAVNQDVPVLVGLSMIVVLAYLLINLLVDLSYVWLDPRVRLGKDVA
jgi:oligopeptide transport system permease protein